jgi:hypothetical protein
MFEVIISNINTGRVERQTFTSRGQASQHADRRVARLAGKRSHSNYRVEIYHRELPVLASLASAPADDAAVAA